MAGLEGLAGSSEGLEASTGLSRFNGELQDSRRVWQDQGASRVHVELEGNWGVWLMGLLSGLCRDSSSGGGARGLKTAWCHEVAGYKCSLRAGVSSWSSPVPGLGTCTEVQLD